MAPLNNYVFINCPFDSDYQPLLRIICFAVLSCGFRPRCALETIDSAQNRLTKILQIIDESAFSIHDISRTELNDRGLPRFNMPFELGIFFGCKHFGGKRHRGKRTLILDREKYRYREFLSDISGQDLESHDDQPEQAVAKVRHWLATQMDEPLSGPTHILRNFAYFLTDRPVACLQSNLVEAELSYRDELILMQKWIHAMEIATESI